MSKHLVVTGQLLDDEPEQALTHARAARALAGRIGVVRLAAGLAAYAAQEWAEALSELRAARRITGRPEHLAVMADCERALGRPERALAYGDDHEVPSLSQDERVELVIVLAGARRDMGQLDAAVLALQTPARATTAKRPWAVRLWYAFADALLAAGREDEARDWFGRTAELDAGGETDAADRLLELDGIVLDDLGEDVEDQAGEGMDDASLAAYLAEGRHAAARPSEPEVDGSAETETSASDGALEADPSGPFSALPGQSPTLGTSRPAVALVPTFVAAPASDDVRARHSEDPEAAAGEVVGRPAPQEREPGLERDHRGGADPDQGYQAASGARSSVSDDDGDEGPTPDDDGELTLFS